MHTPVKTLPLQTPQLANGHSHRALNMNKKKIVIILNIYIDIIPIIISGN